MCKSMRMYIYGCVTTYEMLYDHYTLRRSRSPLRLVLVLLGSLLLSPKSASETTVRSMKSVKVESTSKAKKKLRK